MSFVPLSLRNNQGGREGIKREREREKKPLSQNERKRWRGAAVACDKVVTFVCVLSSFFFLSHLGTVKYSQLAELEGEVEQERRPIAKALAVCECAKTHYDERRRRR